jgi:hypothetical protein
MIKIPQWGVSTKPIMASSDAPAKNQTGRVAPLQILKTRRGKPGSAIPISLVKTTGDIADKEHPQLQNK